MKFSHVMLTQTGLAVLSILIIAVPETLANDAVDKQCATQPVYRTTETFNDINDTINQFNRQWGSENVLLVFDIDNTLLSMTQNLGSDQWFDWQMALLKHNPQDPRLTATSFSGLLDVQALLWQMGKMHPPEPEQPGLINQWQKQGFTLLLLTSRGPENMDITVKALKQNGYDTERSSFPLKDGFSAEFLPYHRTEVTVSGMNIKEAITIGLGFATHQECIDRKLGFKAPCLEKPRSVKYGHGIFLTAGQNKGVMLRILLHKAGFTGPKRFKAIVYADDKAKHVRHIYLTFCQQPVELALFHYTHEAKRVENFKNSDKMKVVNKWEKIQNVLDFLNNPEG